MSDDLRHSIQPQTTHYHSNFFSVDASFPLFYTSRKAKLKYCTLTWSHCLYVNMSAAVMSPDPTPTIPSIGLRKNGRPPFSDSNLPNLQLKY